MHMYGCIEHDYEHITALALVHACPIMHELLEDLQSVTSVSGKEKQEADRDVNVKGTAAVSAQQRVRSSSATASRVSQL